MPLAEIDETLAEQQQRLAFKPKDLGSIYGAPENAVSVGGTVDANLTGTGRLHHGMVRSSAGHERGNGLGTAFKAGGPRGE